MDRAAIQSQVAGCLAYSGEPLVFGSGSLYGVLESVAIEDVGIEVAFQGQGFRLSYSQYSQTVSPKAGDTFTDSKLSRYRIINDPQTHPTTLKTECLVESIP